MHRRPRVSGSSRCFGVVVPTLLTVFGAPACGEVSCREMRTCPEETTGSGGAVARGGAAGNAGASQAGGGAGGSLLSTSGSGGTSGTGGGGGNAGIPATQVGGGGGAVATGGSSGGDGGAAANGTGGASDFGGGGSTGDGGGAGNAGAADSGGEGGAAGECDPHAPPAEQSCLVSDEFAIFVSPLGSDAGAGSRNDPLADLGEAITRANERGKLVIACSTADAPLLTPLEVGGELDVGVYGGFSCADWTWDANIKTVVSPASGPALKLEGVSGSLRIESFEFRAADATEPGSSSVAAVVASSEGVVLHRVALVAGNGAPGADGAGISEFASANLNGHPATGEAGGDPRTTTQCGCATSGGRGGDSEGLMDGGDGTPSRDDGRGRGGSARLACAEGGGGHDGAPALGTGAPGESAMTLGNLDGTTWVPASGAPGDAGSPGQGGGGGAGHTSGGGGGGACGGCGGKGGNPGLGGGGSIALISVDSTIVLTESQLQTGNGGQGGDGAAGQPGQAGGFGGAFAGGACQGGRGGNGASGGAGGGGAGGIAAGILHVGPAPDRAGITFVIGSAGVGGQSADDAAADGISGARVETYAVVP